MAEANRLAAALRYQQGMALPTPEPDSMVGRALDAAAQWGRGVQKNVSDLVSPTAWAEALKNPPRGVLSQMNPENKQEMINQGIDSALNFGPGVLGTVRAVGGKLMAAPQAEALRLAQQRAALPVDQGGLGLPAGNTPQQRAAAMGFDIDAYKGMYPYDVGSSPSFGFKNGKFQQLDKFGEELLPVTEMVPELMSKMELGGKHAGFYGGKDVANRFAGYGTNSAVFPVKLNMGQNPLVKDASGQYAGRYQFERPARDAGMLDDYRDFHGAFFRDSPSTGAILKNTTDEGTIFIPKSGEQVRSRFAAFDPFRRNAAVAAAMGVAAPDLLAQENK